MHRPTRGRTRAGRLRRLDEDVGLEEAALLARADGCVVDFGVGIAPVTTLEWAASLPAHLRVVGVDVVGGPPVGRVELVAGTFDLPPAARPALLVRAANVLRGYPPAAADPARARLGAALVPGGALVEGTTDPDGGVAVFGWWRRHGAGLRAEGMLFSTDFSSGFAPLLFRDRLPRDQRAVTDPALRGLFDDWVRAYEDVRRTVSDAPGRFAAAAARLAATRSDVPHRPERWAAGRLWWRPPARELPLGA